MSRSRWSSTAGRGSPRATLRQAIALGVAKVNYGTYLKQRYLQGRARGDRVAMRSIRTGSWGWAGPRIVLVAGRLAVRDAVLERIELLGCCGRADDAGGGLMDVAMKMPDLATTGSPIKVLRWLVAAGQQVRRGEPLLEVETDKAVMQVESVVSGRLSSVSSARATRWRPATVDRDLRDGQAVCRPGRGGRPHRPGRRRSASAAARGSPLTGSRGSAIDRSSPATERPAGSEGQARTIAT